MWNLVELDLIPGRVRAVSPPDPRQMLMVWTSDGLYAVWFGRAATSLRMGTGAEAERGFDAATGVLTWKGAAFPMHGECGPPGARYGGPLPTGTPQGDRLALDPAGRLAGVDTAEGVRFHVPDPPRPGKWSAVGFSPDGRYLLVANEWDVRLFRYAPAKGRPGRQQPLEQLALLRAVRAAPDDDDPRLVYADWLTENDQADHGEFVRLQCEHARRVRGGELFADADRQQELLARYGDAWQAEYPVIRGVTWSGFWRGFPGVTVPNAGTLARHAAAIWDAAPVESVVVQKVDPRNAAALAACPQLNRVRVLELRGVVSTDLGPLLAGPGLSGLWWLAFLGHSRLDRDVLELLANSESLRGLEVLTLGRCEIDDDGARALIASPHLSRLRDLDLTGNEFTGDVPADLRNRFPGVRF